MRPERPYVLLSCAVSIDGYLDDAGPERLVLSGPEDLDRVDAVRASCDAILVGANTVRRDDPRLVLRSAARRAERRRRGLPADPVKVTLTGGGDLPPSSRFFTEGDGRKLVYCPDARAAALAGRLGGAATVVPLGGGERVELADVLADLAGRGVARLMVEGGAAVLARFLAAGLADELQLAVAPLLLGGAGAARFTAGDPLPWAAGRRLTVAEARTAGDVAVLRYLLPRPGPEGGG
jgi:5-amino-6-(5-phosphoribosylamino)uracil reductase